MDQNNWITQPNANSEVNKLIQLGETYGNNKFSDENFNKAKSCFIKAISIDPDPRAYRFIILLCRKYLHYYINILDMKNTAEVYKTGIHWANEGIEKNIPGQFTIWQQDLTKDFNAGIILQSKDKSVPLFDVKKKKLVIQFCIFIVIALIFFVISLIFNQLYLIIVSSLALVTTCCILFYLFLYSKRQKKNKKKLNDTVLEVEKELKLPEMPIPDKK